MSSISLLLVVALLVLVVGVVILAVWLSRRTESTEPSRAGSIPAAGRATAPAVDEPMAAPTGADPAHDGLAEGVPDEGVPAERVPDDGEPGTSDDREAVTQAELDADSGADEPVHEDGFWDDDESVGEAVGGTEGETAEPFTAEPAAGERSPLDETDVDSTPLFRTIRDERFGAPAKDDEAERSWSRERRDLDVQAHAVDEPMPEEPAMDESVMEESEMKEPEMNESVMEEPVMEEPAMGPAVRRISELHEVVDGGFGIGSAATISDGAQPLGHPIKANRDTRTYQDLRSPWYDETDPDVWFLDVGFAERAGFHRAE